MTNVSEPIELYITANADCNIIPLLSALMPVNIDYKLKFYNPTLDSIELTPAIEYNNHLFTPFLNMLSISPNYPDVYGGQTLQRTAIFSQNGINASIDQFEFWDVHNGTTTIIDVSATNGIDTISLPFTDNGDTSYATITNAVLMSLGYLNGTGTAGAFTEDEQIEIIETIVATCTPNVSEFIGGWGCGGELCQT